MQIKFTPTDAIQVYVGYFNGSKVIIADKDNPIEANAEFGAFLLGVSSGVFTEIKPEPGAKPKVKRIVAPSTEKLAGKTTIDALKKLCKENDIKVAFGESKVILVEKLKRAGVLK